MPELRRREARNVATPLSCCSADDVISMPETLLVTAGKPLLTLESADAMASAAIAEAKRRKFKDISVFVLDGAGRVIVSKTMLNCPLLIPELAHGKAGAAIGTHSSSRALKDKCVPLSLPLRVVMRGEHSSEMYSLTSTYSNCVVQVCSRPYSPAPCNDDHRWQQQPALLCCPRWCPLPGWIKQYHRCHWGFWGFCR